MAPMPLDELGSGMTAPPEAVGAGGWGPIFGGRMKTPTATAMRITTAPISATGAKRFRNSQPRAAGAAAARSRASAHRSGAGTRSRLRNRSYRSVISITQDLLEPLATAAQVRAHCELRGAGAARDLAHRYIGVVEEDDHRSLLGRQQGQGVDQLGVDLRIEVPSVW